MTRINPEIRMNRMQEQIDRLLGEVEALRGEMHDLRNQAAVDGTAEDLSPKRKSAA
jgi:TolA-binding protein